MGFFHATTCVHWSGAEIIFWRGGTKGRNGPNISLLGTDLGPWKLSRCVGFATKPKLAVVASSGGKQR